MIKGMIKGMTVKIVRQKRRNTEPRILLRSGNLNTTGQLVSVTTTQKLITGKTHQMNFL